MKIDNSLLQAGALLGVIGIALAAACQHQWGLVSAAVTGLVALINIHPKGSSADPQSQEGDT